MIERLSDFIKRFDMLVGRYQTLVDSMDIDNRGGEDSSAWHAYRESLVMMEEQFVKAKSALRPIKADIMRFDRARGNRAASAKLAQIENSILKGTHSTIEKPSSITRATTLAKASQEYIDFLEESNESAELTSNVNDLQDEINNYINLIKDRMKI